MWSSTRAQAGGHLGVARALVESGGCELAAVMDHEHWSPEMLAELRRRGDLVSFFRQIAAKQSGKLLEELPPGPSRHPCL